jgi:hypothetical protein
MPVSDMRAVFCWVCSSAARVLVPNMAACGFKLAGAVRADLRDPGHSVGMVAPRQPGLGSRRCPWHRPKAAARGEIHRAFWQSRIPSPSESAAFPGRFRRKLGWTESESSQLNYQFLKPYSASHWQYEAYYEYHPSSADATAGTSHCSAVGDARALSSSALPSLSLALSRSLALSFSLALCSNQLIRAWMRWAAKPACSR